MAWLVDTSILVRLANADDAAHHVAAKAVKTLQSHGQFLRTSPQNLVEFQNCSTRPPAVNGLGLALDDACAQRKKFESLFPLLTETGDIYPAWEKLVQAAGVIGKQVHDARLFAICQVHGVRYILTFNAQHFVRLAGFVPGLKVVNPNDESALASLD
jgi:predicted nucleic acid-binding protein